MAKILLLLSAIISSFIVISSAFSEPESSNFSPSAAHKELTSYGFPIGLLPTNVRQCSVNHTSGDFSVHLDDLCKLILPPDNYLATYSKTITGKIVENRIAELDGIKVRAFFKWWSITGIRLSGDDLVFEVGVVSARYPAKNFVEIPACQGAKADV